jgi:hypothetical protein
MGLGDIRQMLEKHNITENLQHVINITLDQQYLSVRVDYRGGKFVTEKTFPNNMFGLEALQEFKDSMNTEDKVKSYFKLGV